MINCADGKLINLNINIPPRFGKTTMLTLWVAWCLARDARSNFIYTSYSTTLAESQTANIREIITLHEYKLLFPWVNLRQDSSAKGHYVTTKNGCVIGTGAGSSITGFGAGIVGLDKFGGAIIIDDSIKPEDAFSETMRNNINRWYYNTVLSRKNTPNAPPIVTGKQCQLQIL